MKARPNELAAGKKPRDGWPCLFSIHQTQNREGCETRKFLSGNTEAKDSKGKAYEFGTVHAKRLRTTRLEGLDDLSYTSIGL